VKGGADDIDISERYLSWFTMQLHHGEGYQVVEGSEKALDFGGIRQMTTSDYGSWQGPVAETMAPWQNNKGGLDPNEDWSLPNEMMNRVPKEDVLHVQNVDYLPECAVFDTVDETTNRPTGYHFDKNAMMAIKQALMRDGVLDASYYSGTWLPGQVGNPESQIINSETSAQYCNQYLPANHEISVVGWDDTFSSDNFKITPKDEDGNALNGAWIVKNSWGTGKTGQGNDAEGYMYISYYDQTITEFSAFQVDLQEHGYYRYDNNYQYDYMGIKSMITTQAMPNAGQKMANVFTVEKDEILTAVSANTVDTDSQVAIEIYKLPSGAVVPAQGECVSTQEAEIPFGGYHTIDLDTPVMLKAGERFAVVESIVGSSGTWLPIEMGIDGEINRGSGKIKAIATIEEGQSFIYDPSDQEAIEGWSDIKNIPSIPISEDMSCNFGNAMIKAFTEDQDPTAAVTLAVESFSNTDQALGSQTISDLSTAVVLPEGTEKIALSKIVKNGTALLSVNGEDYEEGAGIARDIFEKPGAVTISTRSDGRGNNEKQYILNFKVKTVILPEEKEVTEITQTDASKKTTEIGKNVSTGVIENKQNAALISAGLLILLIGACIALKKKNIG
ncbi:MAG: lectin like domain-containing protein, partial [Eubacterium sp.]